MVMVSPALTGTVVMLSKGAFAGHIRTNSVPILIQAGSDELEMTDDHNDIEDEPMMMVRQMGKEVSGLIGWVSEVLVGCPALLGRCPA